MKVDGSFAGSGAAFEGKNRQAGDGDVARCNWRGYAQDGTTETSRISTNGYVLAKGFGDVDRVTYIECIAGNRARIINGDLWMETPGKGVRLVSPDGGSAVLVTLTDAGKFNIPIGNLPAEVGIAVSDEATAITTGTAKVTFRMPFAMTLTAVRANLNTASSSGIPTVDINDSGTTILSTKLTIDAGEKTSTTAAVPAVISDAALADDAELTIDIDVAGTGAKGLKVWLIGTRA